jgi:hypothetical protein
MKATAIMAATTGVHHLRPILFVYFPGFFDTVSGINSSFFQVFPNLRRAFFDF